MELLVALADSFDHTAKLLGGVRADQLDAPTPCREWDVRALVSHTIGVVMNMGLGARGKDLLADMKGVPLTDDLQSQFAKEAGHTLMAWRDNDFEGAVNVGAGPMPSSLAASINLVDTTTHSWDIARATGQDATIPDDLARATLDVARGFVTDEIRAFAGFDPVQPVADDASSTAQLIAFMGRTP